MNALWLYRLARFLYLKKIPLIPKCLHYLNFSLTRCIVPPSAILGKNVKLAYGGIAVIIHSQCTIGNNVVIGSCATIGAASNASDCPVIGSNVYIGTGAKILGKITIGDNIIIGANSVVVKSMPPNSIVAGVPAQVIRQTYKSIWNIMNDRSFHS